MKILSIGDCARREEAHWPAGRNGCPLTSRPLFFLGIQINLWARQGIHRQTKSLLQLLNDMAHADALDFWCDSGGVCEAANIGVSLEDQAIESAVGDEDIISLRCECARKRSSA
jgi:hypothetical protein